MADDLPPELEAIANLLRTPTPLEAREPPKNEAELDAEYDEIMSALDNLDEKQAAELDSLAARAAEDLGDAPPEAPPTA
jgi:hypothetical protein